MPLHAAVKQLREVHFQGKILTADGMTQNDVVALMPYLEDVYFTQGWLKDSDFEKEYKNVYNEDVPSINLAFVALGYDAVTLVKKAVLKLEKDGQKVSPENLRGAIGSTKFQGVSGEIHFGNNRQTELKQPVLIIKAGKVSRVFR